MKTKHGAAINGKSTPEYNSWRSCKQRCYNKNHHRYPSYGAKGITVCQAWQGQNGFENFLKDMGERPEPKNKYSLERVNPYGNYSVENCVWSTAKTQSKNFRAKLVKHSCVNCRKTFAAMKHAKYCSSVCSYYFNRHKKQGIAKQIKHTTEEKKCLYCNISFMGKKTQLYCSKECREHNQYTKDRQTKNIKAESKLINTFSCVCFICNSSFEGYRSNNKCCSKECYRINRNNHNIIYQRKRYALIKESARQARISFL